MNPAELIPLHPSAYYFHYINLLSLNISYLNGCKQLKTKFDETRITTWYRAFVKECPDGKLTRDHLIRLFKKVFPQGDGEIFCDHIFRVFDDDGNNSLEFRVGY